ncbi:LysR family transcriptional regulator [Planosporangium thailandense]|uniref:LysR family transcriptional regulator n=1 Tax=Planosporangium thailandense TaxID=765197 RepID=A0ABX0Y6K6_9ACTN|nr:LysR family transcriptional regulator [Planosporangium thailandense]
MQYRRLKYFVAVAEELSFTRAAERLHMAQPPLSHQIGLLENELGVALFDRSRRAIRLTDAGQALLPEARRLLADLDQTVRMVRRVGDGARGVLSIGFVPSAANGDLPHLIRSFRADHPGVELVLREMGPDALVRALHDRQLDVALLYLPVSDPELTSYRLSTERLLLALPTDHPAVNTGPVDLRDVRHEPFVMPEQHDVPGLHARITELFTEAGIAPEVAQQGVWLIQTVLGLVAAGIGLAIVPESVATLNRSGVTLRPLRGTPRTVELAAVWRRDDRSDLVADFRDCIKREIPARAGPVHRRRWMDL